VFGGMTRSSLAWAAVLAGFLSWSSPSMAQHAGGGSAANQGDPLSSDPNDPGNLLRDIAAEKEALFQVSPLGALRVRTTRAKEALYEALSDKPERD
jgi:hypothetical protein